jgi:hypothetical protein
MSISDVGVLVTLIVTGAGMVYKLGQIHQSSQAIGDQVKNLGSKLEELMGKHDAIASRLARVEAWHEAQNQRTR